MWVSLCLRGLTPLCLSSPFAQQGRWWLPPAEESYVSTGGHCPVLVHSSLLISSLKQWCPQDKTWADRGRLCDFEQVGKAFRAYFLGNCNVCILELLRLSNNSQQVFSTALIHNASDKYPLTAMWWHLHLEINIRLQQLFDSVWGHYYKFTRWRLYSC